MASQQNPSKRPRLSLQIKTSVGTASKSARGFQVNPNDPTAFNTLSNAYVTAVERSTPLQSEPLTAIRTLQAFNIQTPCEYKTTQQRPVTPYVASYPDTPVSANSPAKRMEINYPSTMTATPPLSAAPASANKDSKVFTFSTADTAGSPLIQNLKSPIEPRSPARRAAASLALKRSIQLPYGHNRDLHSILRNSPLPPRTAIPLPSPRRQSLRLQEKASRKVDYDSPIEREIVTSRYTRSHIDLLVEEASPMSGSPQSQEPAEPLDLSLAFTANEIEDGGQTPGPFEDMRRRMVGLVNTSSSPAGSSGLRKRKRNEKKRRWVWTIGTEEDDEDDHPGGAVTAIRHAEARQARARSEDDAVTPMAPVPAVHIQVPHQRPQVNCDEVLTPSIETFDESSTTGSVDVDMSDSCIIASRETSRGLTPSDAGEVDMKTPVGPKRREDSLGVRRKRDTPIPELSGDKQRDTPIPELEGRQRDTPIPELSQKQRDTPVPELEGRQQEAPMPPEEEL